MGDTDEGKTSVQEETNEVNTDMKGGLSQVIKVNEKEEKLNKEIDTTGEFVNSDGQIIQDEDEDDIEIDEEEREEERQRANEEFDKFSEGQESVDLAGFKQIVPGLGHYMEEVSIEREFNKLLSKSNTTLLSRLSVEQWHLDRMFSEEDEEDEDDEEPKYVTDGIKDDKKEHGSTSSSQTSNNGTGGFSAEVMAKYGMKNKWKCPACYIPNPLEVVQCKGCETYREGYEPTQEETSKSKGILNLGSKPSLLKTPNTGTSSLLNLQSGGKSLLSSNLSGKPIGLLSVSNTGNDKLSPKTILGKASTSQPPLALNRPLTMKAPGQNDTSSAITSGTLTSTSKLGGLTTGGSNGLGSLGLGSKTASSQPPLALNQPLTKKAPGQNDTSPLLTGADFVKESTLNSGSVSIDEKKKHFEDSRMENGLRKENVMDIESVECNEKSKQASFKSDNIVSSKELDNEDNMSSDENDFKTNVDVLLTEVKDDKSTENSENILKSLSV